MSNYPAISIITPCYNSDQYLEETIQSVLQQNYPNLEYIIIDGGSTDRTVDIIQKYQNKLSYWTSEKDNGLYDALQKGFSRSSGEIMAWINADDLYHKNSFFIISEIFKNFSNVNWLVGATTQLDEYGKWIYVNQSKKFTRYDFLLGNFEWIQQESCFWRRALWEKAGSYINNKLNYAGDFDLWLRFFKFEPLYVTNSLIGGFRIRSKNQLSLEKYDDYLNEVKNILSKEKINNKEKHLLRQYKLLNIFMRILIIMNSLYTKYLLYWYKKKKISIAKEIIFNRKEQKYEIL